MIIYKHFSNSILQRHIYVCTNVIAKWLKSEANFFGHTLSIVANPLTMVSHAWLSIDIRGGAGETVN